MATEASNSTPESEYESESETESQPDQKSPHHPSSSSDHSESDTDTIPVPDPTIKPTPMVSTSKPPKSTTGKRSSAELDAGNVKRVKKGLVLALAAPKAETGREKKPLFERIWSEENEVELIQGMIDYVKQKSEDPLKDGCQFYDFVKESLHLDVDIKQLLAKSRKLKMKFENNAAKVEDNQKVRSFSKPHEKEMFELSKNLWGTDRFNKKVKVTNKNPKKVSFGHATEMGKMSGNEDEIMRYGFEKLSGEKKVAMEEAWKDVKVRELELQIKKMDLLKKQAKVVLKAITKSAGGGGGGGAK